MIRSISQNRFLKNRKPKDQKTHKLQRNLCKAIDTFQAGIQFL